MGKIDAEYLRNLDEILKSGDDAEEEENEAIVTSDVVEGNITRMMFVLPNRLCCIL